jgi:hypothetical protein
LLAHAFTTDAWSCGPLENLYLYLLYGKEREKREEGLGGEALTNTSAAACVLALKLRILYPYPHPPRPLTPDPGAKSLTAAAQRAKNRFDLDSDKPTAPVGRDAVPGLRDRDYKGLYIQAPHVSREVIIDGKAVQVSVRRE